MIRASWKLWRKLRNVIAVLNKVIFQIKFLHGKESSKFLSTCGLEAQSVVTDQLLSGRHGFEFRRSLIFFRLPFCNCLE